MIQLTLYTTAGCHLCELANDILTVVKSNYSLAVEYSDIADNDDLVERYGIRIPVIKFPDESELGWPFELSDIESKLIQL